MPILKRLIIAAAVLTPVLAPAAAGAQDLSPITLADYSVVPAHLRTAVVYDQGQAIGIVAHVETDATGRPFRVDVQLPGGKVLKLETAALSYDTQTNEVAVTDSNPVHLAMK